MYTNTSGTCAMLSAIRCHLSRLQTVWCHFINMFQFLCVKHMTLWALIHIGQLDILPFLLFTLASKLIVLQMLTASKGKPEMACMQVLYSYSDCNDSCNKYIFMQTS